MGSRGEAGEPLVDLSGKCLGLGPQNSIFNYMIARRVPFNHECKASALRPTRQKCPIIKKVMFRVQFHYKRSKTSGERFFKASMTEPDNAMSIPEIISRYMRGHGIQVPILPDVSDQAASEDDLTVQDDPDMLDPFGTLPADSEPADSKAAPDGAPQSAPSE